MTGILQTIANATNGKSYNTYKYCYDRLNVPGLEYDDHKEITWERIGETISHKKSVNLCKRAEQIAQDEPLFRYFLDGSRRVFKVDDVSYRNRVYPIVAGQVGVGCCKRVCKDMEPFKYDRKIAISLPSIANQTDWDEDGIFFSNLRLKINEIDFLKKRQIEFTNILSYRYTTDEHERLENRAIGVIQKLMVEQEIKMVSHLASKNTLNQNEYLLKDGSLEYRVLDMKDERELRRFRNNYRWVVGVSKSFNPENCKDSRGRNNSDQIVKLPIYHRTPVSMYSSPRIGNMKFAVWYLRIRREEFTSNAFDGILKIEKILVTDEQISQGVDTEEVDLITSNLINERNPVCHGADLRWANHLYPVFITERYVKSKYLSNQLFLSMF